MDPQKIDSVLEWAQKAVDPSIARLLSLNVSKEFQKIVKYQVEAGGKRLRPALSIISCLLLGGRTKEVLYPAAGLEILHNYFLIIDDIIDNSFLRRNKPTLWAKFGSSIAQCIAIDYAATIFQAANRSRESIKVSGVFARIMKKIVEGEIMDILFEQAGRKEPFVIEKRRRNISEKDYLKMARKKTAVLLEACCEVGGICAGASFQELAALKNYGLNLGIAFQIRDDILDIFGQKEKFGKKIGKDIEERKGGNIVLIFALKELPQKEKNKILKIIKKEEVPAPTRRRRRGEKEKDIEEAIRLIKKTNAHQKALLYGEKFIEKAKDSLNLLPQNKWNKILEEIAEFIIRREK